MLQIKSLNIRLGAQSLLQDLNAEVAAGEVLTLMGPSGSGKSSLLHWLVGALEPAFEAQGELILNGQRLELLPIEQRQIGILFQDDLLFAHLSVGQNLAFALAAGKFTRSERQAKIETELEQIGLAGFYSRDPATLSGGQRARVSALRALLAKPQALLLDEPFSKLDAHLRGQFREFVFERIKTLAIPALMATHDQADVPPNGRVLQIGDYQHA